jgi:hypothetical protein
MNEVFLTLTFCLCLLNAICLAVLALAIRIELKTREMKRKLSSQSVELEDFLADLRSHGFGVIRIDPGSVFLRGRKDMP